jgi:hypothetical protein
MTLQNMGHVNLEGVEEVEDLVAAEIACGMREGTNVADLQQSLQDSKSGKSSDTGDMLRALGGGDARVSSDSVVETSNDW